jgi:tRNA G46 methylase TrmB
VPNGLLTIKTDNEELFEFTKKNLEKNHYNIKLADTNSGLINEFDAQSEYETHFRKLGKPIFRIITTPGEEIYAK